MIDKIVVLINIDSFKESNSQEQVLSRYNTQVRRYLVFSFFNKRYFSKNFIFTAGEWIPRLWGNFFHGTANIDPDYNWAQ